MVLIGTNVQASELRLVEGLIAAIVEKGYAATTIADIVRQARVSKRTFYEHFEDKEACFLATYTFASGSVLQAVEDAFATRTAWLEQLEAGIDAYVTALESNPPLTRSCMVELPAAGPRALELRRKVRNDFATLIADFVRRTRRREPAVRELSEAMIAALVGAIDELVLVQVERGPQHRLAALRETASELFRAVLLSPPARRARRGSRP